MKSFGEMPLIKALKLCSIKDKVPFHMPGHKKGTGVLPEFRELMRDNPFALDLTELPDLDDLHNPMGPIKEAQERAALLFGADESLYLVNGSTTGIHAAIMSTCRNGAEILLPRDVHRSVIGACILAGARPRYLPLRLERRFLVPVPPTVEEVSAAILEGNERGSKLGAVLQIYPSYYGLTGHLDKVAEACHSHGLPVIVDEAHGAHFAFDKRLPETALASGADIVVQSTHKTLGALTQASMLHIKSGLVDYNEVKRQLRILQSTSPSFLLLASLDGAVSLVESKGEALVKQTVAISLRLRKELATIPGLNLLGQGATGIPGIKGYDPTKLYISVKGLGLTGTETAEILLDKFGIQVELRDRFSILCMISIGNTREDADRLVSAMREIAAGRTGFRGNGEFPADCLESLPQPKVEMTPREAWFSTREEVPLKESAGRIAAEIVAPYPPGVPLICPGELITCEVVECIRTLKKSFTSFHGPADPELRFITVVRD